MVGNPVFTHALRSTLRQKRSYVLLACYLGVLSAAIAREYPENIVLYEYAERHFPPSYRVVGLPTMQFTISSQAPAIGRTIFESFIRMELILVLVLVPALHATALTEEKERHTLDDLKVTGLSALEIVAGKFCCGLCLTFVLIVSSVPLTAVSFMLGGVSPSEFVSAYGKVATLALVLSSIGFIASAAASRSHSSLFVAYSASALCGISLLFAGDIAVFVWLAIGMLVVILFGSVGIMDEIRSGRLLALAMSCFWFIYMTLSLSDGNMPMWMAAAGAIGGMLVMSTYGATVMVERGQAASVGLRGRLEGWASSWRANSKQPPSRRTQSNTDGFPDRLNPVFARELRGSFFGRREQLVRALYTATIVIELFLMVFFLVDAGLEVLPGLMRGVATAAVMAILTFGCLIGVLVLSAERDRSSLDLLLTTPLSSAEIVVGKCLGGLYFTGYLVVACAPVFIIMATFGDQAAYGWLLMMLAMSAWAAWSVLLGMWSYLLFIRSRPAVLISLGVIVAMAGISWMGVATLPGRSLDPPFYASWVWLMPPYQAYSFMGGLWDWMLFEPLDPDRARSLMTCAAWYAFSGLIMLMFASRGFDLRLRGTDTVPILISAETVRERMVANLRREIERQHA